MNYGDIIWDCFKFLLIVGIIFAVLLTAGLIYGSQYLSRHVEISMKWK